MITDWTDHATKLVTWLDQDVILKMTDALDSVSGWEMRTNDIFQMLTGYSHMVKYTPDLISELGAGCYYCERFVTTPETTLSRFPPFLRHACKSAVFKVKQLDSDAVEPRVTVITATYNREESCVKAVQSVLDQTYKNIRHLIVRDGPGKYNSLPSDPRVEFHDLPRRGKYPANPEKRWHVAGMDPWNYANAMTEGPILCLLDDDDIYYPDHVETIVEEWKKTKAHIIYTESYTSEIGTPFDFDFDPDLLEKQNFIFACTTAYCGAALTLACTPHYAEIPGDWASLRRMQEAGMVFKKINKVTTEHAHETITRARKARAHKLGMVPGNKQETTD